MEGRHLFSQHFNDKEELVTRKTIIKSESGFTMVELIITMVVFVFVIAAASSVFTGLLTQFKQQSKIAETNVEGVVGLEILRQDIEHAGYGLPWNFQNAINYNEAMPPASTYNDAPDNATAALWHNVPRPIVSGNDVSYSGQIYDGSDYLVIKAVNITQDPVSRKFTTLSSVSPYIVTWDPAAENLDNSDNVIVLSPGTTDADAETLIVSGSAFYTAFANVTSPPWPPLDQTKTNVVYGISAGSVTPRMPFNRADYYIKIPTSNMPQRCARKADGTPGTGILYKGTLNHTTGQLDELPLLDCVADMQVVFYVDNSAANDGTVMTYIPDLSILTGGNSPLNIRNRVKEVRVYILAHEGQRDPNYTYPNSTIMMPYQCPPNGPLPYDPACGAGRPSPGFDLTRISEYQHYRWKVYTVVVRPIDLR